MKNHLHYLQPNHTLPRKHGACSIGRFVVLVLSSTKVFQIILHLINDFSLQTDIIEWISIFHGLQQSNIGRTYTCTCIHVNIFSNVYSQNFISVTKNSITTL